MASRILPIKWYRKYILPRDYDLYYLNTLVNRESSGSPISYETPRIDMKSIVARMRDPKTIVEYSEYNASLVAKVLSFDGKMLFKVLSYPISNYLLIEICNNTLFSNTRDVIISHLRGLTNIPTDYNLNKNILTELIRLNITPIGIEDQVFKTPVYYPCDSMLDKLLNSNVSKWFRIFRVPPIVSDDYMSKLPLEVQTWFHLDTDINCDLKAPTDEIKAGIILAKGYASMSICAKNGIPYIDKSTIHAVADKLEELDIQTLTVYHRLTNLLFTAHSMSNLCKIHGSKGLFMTY